LIATFLLLAFEVGYFFKAVGSVDLLVGVLSVFPRDLSFESGPAAGVVGSVYAGSASFALFIKALNPAPRPSFSPFLLFFLSSANFL
jgi:hypothetical protein